MPTASCVLQDYMAFKRVYGSGTFLGLQEDMTYGPLTGTRMAKCKATFEGVHVVLKVQPHPLEIQTKTWLLPRLLVKSQLAPVLAAEERNTQKGLVKSTDISTRAPASASMSFGGSGVSHGALMRINRKHCPLPGSSPPLATHPPLVVQRRTRRTP